MTLPPMISAKALGAMPQFTLEYVGEKALDRALKTAGLPHEFVEKRDGYISKHALATFVENVGRSLGEGHIGLLWAPSLSVTDYGAWGDYVLSAPTLGAALERASAAMPLHSTTDRTFLRVQEDVAGYEYRFGLKGHDAYPNIAFSALGSVLSIFRHYLGDGWRPLRITCDLLQPKDHEVVADTFGCDIIWGSKRLEIVFRRSELESFHETAQTIGATLQDVQLERSGILPRCFADVVSGVIRLQIASDRINLEAAARAIDVGPRALQRRLSAEGTSFRVLSNQILAEVAVDLLQDGTNSVQDVATYLGYENAQNFSRAFRRNVGRAPSTYFGTTLTD